MKRGIVFGLVCLLMPVHVFGASGCKVATVNYDTALQQFIDNRNAGEGKLKILQVADRLVKKLGSDSELGPLLCNHYASALHCQGLIFQAERELNELMSLESLERPADLPELVNVEVDLEHVCSELDYDCDDIVDVIVDNFKNAVSDAEKAWAWDHYSKCFAHYQQKGKREAQRIQREAMDCMIKSNQDGPEKDARLRSALEGYKIKNFDPFLPLDVAMSVNLYGPQPGMFYRFSQLEGFERMITCEMLENEGEGAPSLPQQAMEGYDTVRRDLSIIYNSLVRYLSEINTKMRNSNYSYETHGTSLCKTLRETTVNVGGTECSLDDVTNLFTGLWASADEFPDRYCDDGKSPCDSCLVLAELNERMQVATSPPKSRKKKRKKKKKKK